jgi:hydroxylamine reductase
MFCYQCEQTFKGTGCVVQGICGKTPNVAILQDLLIYALKGLSFVAEKTMDYNLVTEEIDKLILMKRAFLMQLPKLFH